MSDEQAPLEEENPSEVKEEAPVKEETHSEVKEQSSADETTAESENQAQPPTELQIHEMSEEEPTQSPKGVIGIVDTLAESVQKIADYFNSLDALGDDQSIDSNDEETQNLLKAIAQVDSLPVVADNADIQVTAPLSESLPIDDAKIIVPETGSLPIASSEAEIIIESAENDENLSQNEEIDKQESQSPDVKENEPNLEVPADILTSGSDSHTSLTDTSNLHSSTSEVHGNPALYIG